MKKNILIYGWFGHENLGDELILRSIIELLKSTVGGENLNLNVMGSKPKSIEKYHKNLKTVSTNVDLRIMSIIRIFKYNPYKVIRNLLKNDALVIGSGGAISDWNPDSTKTIFFMIKFFKMLKKPVIILGAGAGPINREGEYFRNVLKKVDFITVRDKESYDLLKSIELNNIYLTNDVVFDLKKDFDKNNKKLCNKKIGIVVAPLIFKNKEKNNKYRDAIINYIKELIDRNICNNIELIPFQYGYDIEFLNEIKKEVDIDIFIKGKDDMWSVMERLNECDMIVGMRYHAVVLGLLMNKAVLPIVYHAKVNSCIKSFALEDVAQYIGDGDNWVESEIDYKKMINDTEKILSNIDNVKQNNIEQKNICNYKVLSEFMDIVWER